jgi:hypothetical protein
MDTIRASLAIGTLTTKRQQTNRHMGAHSRGLMDQMDAMNAVTEIVAMIEHTMTETTARFVWVAAKQGTQVYKSQKEERMTIEDLVNNLTRTIASNVCSLPAVQEALVAFGEVGVRVIEIRFIQLQYVTEDLPAASVASGDSDFLRKLHISADLSISEGGRQ